MRKPLATAISLLLVLQQQLAQAFEINFSETLWIPAYDYTEIVKSQVRIMQEHFKPGKILVTLNLSQTESGDQKFDIFRFANCSAPSYLCYVQAMEFQQYQACQNFYSEQNQQCGNCSNQDCVSQLNNQDLFNQGPQSYSGMWCCLNCSQNLLLQLISDQNQQQIAIGDINQKSEIFIIDNSPFPNGANTIGNKSISFNSTYNVTLTPNNTYYVWTLALAIILAIVLMLLSSCLCILIYKYKKAKSQSQTMNLVSGDENRSLLNKSLQEASIKAKKNKKIQ